MAHIDPAHAQFLLELAITPDMVEKFELTTVTTVEELPEALQSFPVDLTPGLPGLVFWWTEPDGTKIPQIKVREQTVLISGEHAKYIFPIGNSAKLGEFRKVEGSAVLLTEGTKQSIVAAKYAPEGMSVYGFAGCRGWSEDGVPTPHLQVVDGKDVIVLLDSDAASNLDVYNAGLKLAEACEAEGATSVRFARLPGGKKAALDDYLGVREEGRRAATLERVLGAAGAKPAEQKPKPGKKDATIKPTTGDDRPVIIVNDERRLVIQNLTGALLAKWNAKELFSYGGVVCKRAGTTMEPVTKDAFNGIVSETAITVHEIQKGENVSQTYAWPDGQTSGAILARADRFAQLDKIGEIPFIRPDGTVCAVTGYDERTKTFLVLSDELEGLEVPEHPTPEQVKESLTLLTDELLEGFPFAREPWLSAHPEDLANAVATLLTPFVRNLTPTSPLAVIDGKEAGSGKNLFADVVSYVTTGKAAKPKPYSLDDAEQRKVITSSFREGDALFVFDEAHRLEGASFARALTSHTYSDRILGVSTMAEFPNNVTWMSLGNNVAVAGDMARRMYRVRIEFDGESPENRPDEEFRHPDLLEWVKENRASLVKACLTLVRAWFAADRPKTELAFSFGSFTGWQKTLAGVLAHAGLPGFLAGMKEWRSESDHERQFWVSHLRWLSETFGGKEFTTAAVTEKLRAVKHPELPPGKELEDLTKGNYSRLLGQAYAKVKDRKLDGFVLRKLPGTAHGKVAKWTIEAGNPFVQVAEVSRPVPPSGGPAETEGSGVGEANTAPVGGTEGTEVTPPPTHAENTNTPSRDTSSGYAHVISRVGGRGVSPVPSVPSPIAPLLHLADDPGLLTCPDCDTPREVFGAAGILRACPACHPETFGR